MRQNWRHGIQIRGEFGARVLCFWKLVTKVKYLGRLHIENTKKTQSTQLLLYIRLNVAELFSTKLFLTLLCDMGGNMVHKTDVTTL